MPVRAKLRRNDQAADYSVDVQREKCGLPLPEGTGESDVTASEHSTASTRDCLIQNTTQFWQPAADRRLTSKDAEEIIRNCVGFFDLLLAWDSSDRQPKAENSNTNTGTSSQRLPAPDPVGPEAGGENWRDQRKDNLRDSAYENRSRHTLPTPNSKLEAAKRRPSPVPGGKHD